MLLCTGGWFRNFIVRTSSSKLTDSRRASEDVEQSVEPSAFLPPEPQAPVLKPLGPDQP